MTALGNLTILDISKRASTGRRRRKLLCSFDQPRRGAVGPSRRGTVGAPSRPANRCATAPSDHLRGAALQKHERKPPCWHFPLEQHTLKLANDARGDPCDPSFGTELPWPREAASPRETHERPRDKHGRHVQRSDCSDVTRFHAGEAVAACGAKASRCAQCGSGDRPRRAFRGTSFLVPRFSSVSLRFLIWARLSLIADYLGSSAVWSSLLGATGATTDPNDENRILLDWGRVSLLGTEIAARAWLHTDLQIDEVTGALALVPFLFLVQLLTFGRACVGDRRTRPPDLHAQRGWHTRPATAAWCVTPLSQVSRLPVTRTSLDTPAPRPHTPHPVQAAACTSAFAVISRHASSAPLRGPPWRVLPPP